VEQGVMFKPSSIFPLLERGIKGVFTEIVESMILGKSYPLFN
jgi:hypothetical protein